MALRMQPRASPSSVSRKSARSLAVKPICYLPDKAAAAAVLAVAMDKGFKNQLEALKAISVVVADSGEMALVKKYKPQDCTTNPSLVLKAVQNPEYAHLLKQALAQRPAGATLTNPARPYADVADVLAVNIGAEMLQVVPGRVSTEVDAHLSFDTKATVDKALRIVDLYNQKGIDLSRLYIKIASTWEGIEACRQLEQQGIRCNMTLLFSFAQAAACADVGAALISPFVGRILDWYKAKEGRDYASHEDPGVLSVKRIYSYYKTHGFKTIVMAASFRNVGEIRELAGCDNITIAPALLAELEACTDELPRRLSPDTRDDKSSKLVGIDGALFGKLHGAEQMAVDKLQQGIDGFAADQRKLEAMIAELAGK